MSGSVYGRARLAQGAVLLLVSLVMQGCRATQIARDMPPEQKGRFDAMRADGAAASMTVFPVAIAAADKAEKEAGSFGRKVGNVLGLMLEQAGMANLETTDSEFVLPADVPFDEAPARFGEFVRANPIKTDYALFAEVIGRKGNPPRFDEIRHVVVDKAGQCVWSERQTRDDPEFKRGDPDCMMTASLFLSQRVRTHLGISAWARDDSGKGKFARIFAEESPAPKKPEWDAMKKRQAAMKKARKTATVAVYPVRLSNTEVGVADAANLAKLLSGEKLCKAEAIESSLCVEIQPDRNEQKLLWDLARAFQSHVKENPPEADYALLADYMIGSSGPAHAVHFVICDRAGEWVVVDYQNSHHGDFQSIDPKSRADCGRLVARRLGTYLR